MTLSMFILSCRRRRRRVHGLAKRVPGVKLRRRRRTPQSRRPRRRGNYRHKK